MCLTGKLNMVILAAACFWPAQAFPLKLLDNEIIAKADISMLREETRILEQLHKGVVLSLAQCDVLDTCAPPVNRAELRVLIDLLQSRIGVLSNRYNESSEAALEEILITYADTRDDYTALLDRLATIPQLADEADEDDFLNDSGQGGISPELMDLFHDVDEELTEDEL